MEEGNNDIVQGVVGENTMPRMPDHRFDPPVDNNDYWPHGFDRAAVAADPQTGQYEPPAAPPLTPEQRAQDDLIWATWGSGNTRDLPPESNWAQHFSFQWNQALSEQRRHNFQWNLCHICNVYVLQRHCTQCLRPTCNFHAVGFEIVGRQHTAVGMVCRTCVESTDGTILGGQLVFAPSTF
eukprot:2200604-Amphidinium_carterae.2